MDISDEDIDPGRYVFKDVFDVYDFLQSKGWNIGWYAGPYFEVMQLEDNSVVASPTPFNPLYRGQSKVYKNCIPSLCRRTFSDIEKIERELQLNDFKNILNDNPEIMDLLKGNLKVNYLGLAQHYGIETNIIDLTNSFGVAAFFATSDYNPLTDSYIPVTEVMRQGIIYFLPTGMFSFTPNNKTGKILPIGLEALARPGEQRAFGAYVNTGSDLIDFGCLRLYFWQSPAASFECHRRMNFGKTLFPYDPMVEKVRVIRKYRIYGKDSLREVLDKNDNLNWDFNFALDTLTKHGCSFLDSTPFRYTEDELLYLRKQYQQRYSD